MDDWADFVDWHLRKGNIKTDVATVYAKTDKGYEKRQVTASIIECTPEDVMTYCKEKGKPCANIMIKIVSE